jgi:predicted permease
MLNDFRQAARHLRQSPGFALGAGLCMALGMGACAVLFSVADALLFRPVPGVANARGLVSLATLPAPRQGVTAEVYSLPIALSELNGYRARNRVFSGLAAYQLLSFSLATEEAAVEVDGYAVSEGYFELLGLRPARGRFFSPARDLLRQPYEAVVSDDLWRRRWQRSADVVGRKVLLDGIPYSVVGVAPAGFRGNLLGAERDLFVPLETFPRLLPWGQTTLPLLAPDKTPLFSFVARLREGVGLARARAEMDRLSRGLGQATGRRDPVRFDVQSNIGLRPVTRRQVVRLFSLLAGLALLLMLVVCANVGGLLLARVASRRGEIGLRLALGGGRLDVLRRLWAESLILAGLGGAGGLLLTWPALSALSGVSLGRFRPTLRNLTPDLGLAGFTLALMLLVGLGFALIWTLWLARSSRLPVPAEAGAAVGFDPRQGYPQEALVVGQLAASVLLLISTGLIVRTLVNLRAVDPGFDPRQVLTVSVDLERHGVAARASAAVFRDLLAEIRRRPGVRAASFGSGVPLVGGDASYGSLATVRADEAPAGSDSFAGVRYDWVAPDYFFTLGLPLLRGRDFADKDAAGPCVVVVNRALEHLLWRGRPAVGRRLALEDQSCEVIGVVADVRFAELAHPPEPSFYRLAAAASFSRQILVVRAAGDPRRLARPVRSVLRRLAPALGVRTDRLQDAVDRSLAEARLLTWLLATFSGVAVVVTAVGLYATLAFTVTRRTREIGIRMAVGARASRIVLLVLQRGLALTAIGFVLGCVAAAWTTGLFAGFLYEVSPTEPGVFVLVGVFVLLVGLAASAIPAWMATRVDPLTVIRHE